MPEWLQKFFTRVKELWGKWSLVQKIILFAVVGVVILALVLIMTVSSSPGMVTVFNVPVTDANTLFDIGVQLDEEGIAYQTTDAGMIQVKDEDTARRARTVLMRYDLVPDSESPWDFFNVDRWSTTQFERDVNLRRALTQSLEQHIESSNDIDSAAVELVIPEDELFTSQQNPTTVSVVISPTPGSDITENRTKIEGLVSLVQFAVEGLEEDNIKILDNNLQLLNDFEGMADFDRLDLTRRQMEQKQEYERYYKETILQALADIWSPERVRIVNLDISLDLTDRVVDTQEYLPIVLQEDNPETPYSERQVQDSIVVSSQTSSSNYSGSGWNPNGPAGTEGQTPPQYEELDNMVGSWEEQTNNTNYNVNSRTTHEEAAPWAISRITVGVALDGTWKKLLDDKGNVDVTNNEIQREYTPVSDGVLSQAEELVEHAIGYDSSRGDSVTVQHIKFDRSAQFEVENEAYLRQAAIQQNILIGVIAALALVLMYIIFRIISREMEKRRRLREEELARQHQAMREAALRNAEEEGVDVEMSVQERARMEMQENAVNMAREHPEDVAQLIRTWLAEE